MKRIPEGPPHIQGIVQAWVDPHDGSIHLTSNDLGFNIHVSKTRQKSTWSKLAEKLRAAGHAQ